MSNMLRRRRITTFALVLAALLGGLGAEARAAGKGIGAPPPADEQVRILARAQMHVRNGEDSFARGDFEHARTAFDAAVDIFLDSGYDLRSNPELLAAYREAVERVNRYQAMALDGEGEMVWPLQGYEATREDFYVPEVPNADEIAAAGGDMVRAGFLVRVGELQRRFKEKFGRTFTVTGRDTSAHSRLYGSGRAVDVRVRDLNSAQVQFLLQNARALNMRALDFSTSDLVFRHNTRVISLGRSLDTMATGVHLHLNDQPRAYAERAATKQKFTKKQ
jgi:hypothetical protein